ncbi:MAG: enoyl-CoA hydratase, partial [Pseudomonadales bacterium]|nr:enoyl-CoA hydratase [Pseudomonadales bacterium]
TLNRPEKRNALDLTMRQALAESMRLLTNDKQIRAIVITGGDKVFAAGADLNLLVDKSARQVADIDLSNYWAPLANCPKPVIAAVSGYALGAGCELILMCDIVVADSSTRLGQTECTVGIMPGAGGTQRLVRSVGKPLASLMLMTGEIITGERAYHSGLVSELVEDGKTVERAMKLATRAARMPPLALGAIKRSLKQGADLPLDEALALENREFLSLFDTQDKTEGMRAFLEKRKPEFKGQ